jgi:hypothetical protein
VPDPAGGWTFQKQHEKLWQVYDCSQRSKSVGGRFRRWIFGSRRIVAADRLGPRSANQPDPWDAEVEQKLSEPEAAEVCPHCLIQQPPTAWFCKHCGKAVGPYNNMMPFLNVFSEGEVLRNGTTGRFRNRPFILSGYFLITLGINPFFAPIYWFFILFNLNRPPDEQEPAENQSVLP